VSIATRFLNAWRDLAKLPRELWLLCLATFVNRTGTMALPFLALYLTESLKFSSARAGIVLTLWGLVALFMGPVAGKLSDRWGALFMLESMMAAFGVILLFFPLAKSWAAVLVMTALFALTNVGFGPPSLAMISSLSTPEQRKSAFALARLAINLGMSVGPAVGGLLAQVSFPVLFMVDGATALIATAILVFSPFHKRVKKHEAEIKVAETRDGNKWMLHTLFSDTNLQIFLLGIIPVIIVFWQHQSTMPLFLVRDLHFSTSAYGMLFTLSTLMVVTMEIPLNAVTSHWPHRRAFVLGCGLMTLGFGALAVARTYLEVALTVVIWTFGEMILFPAMSAFVAEIAPEGRSGEYMGFYAMGFNFALMAAPGLGTFALEHYGPTQLWLSMLGIGSVSVLIFGVTNVRKN
jgi:predicted MFS family arabinose efflux permease